MNQEEKRVEIRVKGIVQGVFFRAYTRDFAKRQGIKGYVKNLPDGSVEIKAEGPEKQLQKLVEFAKEGSPAAEVYDIDIEWMKSKNEYKVFKVQY